MPLITLPTGATLHYTDTGNAQHTAPVLLIHGFLGTGETEFPHVADWLRETYRVITPTLRGYGDSMPKPRKFPPGTYHQDAKDLAALMDALNIERAHLIGYSDGGEVALIFGGTYPDRCETVITWGAVGYYGPQMRPVAQRMFPATWMTATDKKRHGIDHADAFVLSWIKSVHRIIDSGGDLSLSLADKLTVPVLLMLGERDTLNPIEYGQKFIDRTPNGRLVTFDCGHAVHTEAWESFRRTVGAFLSNPY